MSTSTPAVDVSTKTVTHEGKTYKMQGSNDEYTVVIDGVSVGRVVYSFGAANPVVESDNITEDALGAIGNAWFAALDASQPNEPSEPAV